jgi:hypothetical protein
MSDGGPARNGFAVAMRAGKARFALLHPLYFFLLTFHCSLHRLVRSRRYLPLLRLSPKPDRAHHAIYCQAKKERCKSVSLNRSHETRLEPVMNDRLRCIGLTSSDENHQGDESEDSGSK